MRKTSILLPLFKKIDKVLFGIDDMNEIENKPDLTKDHEDEHDVERSIN